jgi:NADH-quinone oxidoreductase subunit H
MDFIITLFTQYPLDLVWLVAKVILILVPVLMAVSYLTYAERKILGAIHLGKGPNVVGPFGLLQPFADGFKLIFKETIIPSGANKVVFFLAPMVTFFLALIAWAVVSIDAGLVFADVNVGLLYILAISSLSVYGVIMAGWSSNSKYAFYGALRSTAQMVSYEVSLGIIILSVVLCCGSLNLTEIVEAQKTVWYGFIHFPMFVLFFISTLAETGRAPFDLPEGESELVAGFMVEYSSLSFAMFFLAEYANMILMCVLTSILFLGGWLPIIDIAPFNWIPGWIWLGMKVSFLLFAFVWIRATFPRYRYDQLMRLGWKIFLPLSLLWLVLTATILVMMQ